MDKAVSRFVLLPSSSGEGKGIYPGGSAASGTPRPNPALIPGGKRSEEAQGEPWEGFASDPSVI